MATYQIGDRKFETRALTRGERKALAERGLSMIACSEEKAKEVLDAVLLILWPSTEVQATLDQADQSDIATIYRDIYTATYPVDPASKQQRIMRVQKAQIPALKGVMRGLKRFEEKALRAAHGEFRSSVLANGYADIDALADATLALIFPDPDDQALLDAASNAVSLSLFDEVMERSQGRGSAVKN